MTPISYKDALAAMHGERIAVDRGPYALPKNVKMKAACREKLGALVVSTLSDIAESREHHSRGLEFVLGTIHGPLVISYDVAGGDIFQKFEHPTSKVYGSNPHSGKWNFHTGPEDCADAAFSTWKKEIERIL